MINLLLAYHMARLYKQNTDKALLHAARAVRAQTHDGETYRMMGLIVNSTPLERQIMVDGL